ncbi:MAG TPA: response regulator [Gemmatimonadales bacterium]|nr:response regulator [Gemmatimonadales bacterium]
MAGDAPPPELPPRLVEEYLESARSQLDVLAGLADRLAARGDDAEALGELRREIHKVHGSAGSYGFMEASRLAAGIEATVKDWVTRPDDDPAARGSLAGWFVKRLAEMLGLPAPAAVARASLPRVGPPPRPHSPRSQPPPRPAGSARPAPPPATPMPTPPPPRSAAVTAAPVTAPEVIYVEDDAALAELLEYGLRSQGYRFLAFRNGREALGALLALDVQGTRPLLLLDVDLPALDGYSIVAALGRDRPGVYRVVFTTVHGTEEEQLRGLEAGALDYLVKPISLRVALEKIKRWVGR